MEGKLLAHQSPLLAPVHAIYECSYSERLCALLMPRPWLPWNKTNRSVCVLLWCFPAWLARIFCSFLLTLTTLSYSFGTVLYGKLQAVVLCVVSFRSNLNLLSGFSVVDHTDCCLHFHISWMCSWGSKVRQ